MFQQANCSGEHFIGRVMRPPTSFFSNVPGGGGILANDGDSWRDQRRIALSILRDFGMGRNMMEQKIMHSVAEMCDAIDKTEDKSRVNMYPTLQVSDLPVKQTLFVRYRQMAHAVSRS